MDLGAALRRARDEAGLSQRELAERAGVTASTISRYESGAQLPSTALLDRLLAVCGRDLEVRLVQRHHDLQAEFARRAALPWDKRAGGTEFMRPSFLLRILDAGADVLVGGAWGAEILGIPAEPAADGLLLLTPDEVPALATAFSATLPPWRQVEGGFGSMRVTPQVFEENPVARWFHQFVGTFVTEVRDQAATWPPEVRVPTEGRPLRVVAPNALDGVEGVRAQVLEQWRAWRAERDAAG
ncbi:MAG: helix-turn-helix domain-containing protein [Actinomycetes bacterium]